MIAFFSDHLLATHIGIVLISLALIAKASSFSVGAVSSYAKKLGLSNYLTGLFVVAIAASVPEFLASLSGVAFASSSIVFGTIFGSNFLGITLVLGILALMGKKLPVKEKIFQKTKWDILLLVALPFVLLLDGALGIFDGILLLLSFLFYLILLWKREGEVGTLKKKVSMKELYKDGSLFILSLLVVLIASFLMVHSSLQIAQLLHLSELLVAIVIIGVGSQVPDLFLSLQAAKSHNEGVALGELLGSMIAKSLLFLGIFALITPLTLGIPNTIFLGVITVFTSWLLFFFVRKKELLAWHGVVLLALCAAYFVIQIGVF